MTKSQLFSQYNQTKAQARRAGAPQPVLVRINRGLGVAQRKQERPYITTETSCTCPDHTYRGLVCKHMQALRIKNAASQIERRAQILKELGF